MSYTKQVFWALDTYINTLVNKHETNIREHQHSFVNDAVTERYNGYWKSAITSASAIFLNQLDTQNNVTQLLSICNSGMEQLGLLQDRFKKTMIRIYTTINPITGASPSYLSWDTEYQDELNEFSTPNFTPINSGMYAYRIHLQKANATANAYYTTLVFKNISSSFTIDQSVTKLNSVGARESIQLYGQSLLHGNVSYRFEVQSYTGDYFIDGAAAYIYRVL